jgi:hypothetical protein
MNYKYKYLKYKSKYFELIGGNRTKRIEKEIANLTKKGITELKTTESEDIILTFNYKGKQYKITLNEGYPFDYPTILIDGVAHEINERSYTVTMSIEYLLDNVDNSDLFIQQSQHLEVPEHQRSSLLNFRNGYISELPPEFIIPDDGLKIMTSTGDYVHTRDDKLITNVEQYKEYDIFCCLGDDDAPKSVFPRDYTSVMENLDYLDTNHKNKKLLCIIDITDLEQITNFMNLFKNKCIHIFSDTVHSVVFPLEICIDLLKKGGKVILYEWPKELPGFKCSEQSYTEISTERFLENLITCKLESCIDLLKKKEGGEVFLYKWTEGLPAEGLPGFKCSIQPYTEISTKRGFTKLITCEKEFEET